MLSVPGHLALHYDGGGDGVAMQVVTARAPTRWP
jgi:hypothetical protein